MLPRTTRLSRGGTGIARSLSSCQRAYSSQRRGNLEGESSLFKCVLASLYEGLSVRQSVSPSVRPSVRLSVRPSVGDAFVKIGKIDDYYRK